MCVSLVRAVHISPQPLGDSCHRGIWGTLTALASASPGCTLRGPPVAELTLLLFRTYGVLSVALPAQEGTSAMNLWAASPMKSHGPGSFSGP